MAADHCSISQSARTGNRPDWQKHRSWLRTAEQRPCLNCQFEKPEASIEAHRLRLRIDHDTDAPKPLRHLSGQFQREPYEPRADAMSLVSRGDSKSCQTKDR